MSVKQLKENKRTKDGRTWVFIQYSKGLDGKRHQYQSQAYMTKEEAIKILGLPNIFTKDDLKKAYRRAAMKCHPDMVGGKKEDFQKFRDSYCGYTTWTKISNILKIKFPDTINEL